MAEFSTRFAWLKACEDVEQIDPTEADMPAPSLVFEQSGSIKVMEGVASVTVSGGTRLRIEHSVDLPLYANQATVFLNGWQAAYGDTDHHIYDVAVILKRIRVIPGQIQWTATGDLSDKHVDAPFSLSYRFVIIAWNDTSVRAMVDHNDADHFCRTGEPHGGDNFFEGVNTGAPDATTTALSSFPSFLRNPGFATGRQVAVLPRGFVFSVGQMNGGGGDDHHLLQLAYNLESVAPFVRDQNYHKATTMLNPITDAAAGVGNGEFVSWKTSVILKDNSRRHDYAFAEFVSAMGGPDVEILQPEFAVLPREDVDANIVGGGSLAGLKTEDVVINQLPYAYAVPMLTGWDIGYTPPGEGDQHVKDFGVFIDRIQYAAGTLRYTVSSIVRDKDLFPDNYFRHKVTILGLKPISVPPVG